MEIIVYLFVGAVAAGVTFLVKEYIAYRRFIEAYNRAAVTMVLNIEEVPYKDTKVYLMSDLNSNKFLGQASKIEDLYLMAFEKNPKKETLLVKLPGKDDDLAIVQRFPIV